MISVLIHSPVIGKRYEFILKETTPIFELIEEISEMISQSEQFVPEPRTEKFVLYCQKRNSVLDSQKTLKDYGIKTGDDLFLC